MSLAISEISGETPDLDELIKSFDAVIDGKEFKTPTSCLCPIRLKGQPAILKIVTDADEKYSGDMLDYYDGDGAVRLLARKGNALVLERAEGTRDLVSLVRSGKDNESTAIICEVVEKLHKPRPMQPDIPLMSLRRRFCSLFDTTHDNLIFQKAQVCADRLLAEESDIVILHGDIHHDNILYDERRGWLAIDPKGIVGERTYEYANILCNPHALSDIVLNPDRFIAQAKIIAEKARLSLDRLVKFSFCHAALSAAWSFEEANAESGDWFKHGMQLIKMIEPFVDSARKTSYSNDQPRP